MNNSWSRNWHGAMAFVTRGFYLLRRYLAWEIVFTFYNVITTLTMAFIGLSMNTPNPQETILYLVIGALLWSFMSILFQEVADSITWERWEGTIEYTFMSPVKRTTHLLGMSIYAMAYGLIRIMIVLTVVSCFFSFNLSGANLGTALLVMFAASPSFIGLGLIAAILPLLSAEKGAQGTHIIQGMILLVSGVYYDITVLPGWLQSISYMSPGTYVLSAVRAAMLEGATLDLLWPEIVRLLIIGAILVPLGLFIFSLAEKYAMRTGKLKRNG